MMTWTELLEKIKVFKKEYESGQVDLRAGSLISLLFAGGFDSIIGITNVDFLEYQRLAKELLDALGSKASLPKAGKNDVIGIDQISSNLDLHLWRSEANSTYKFDFTDLFESFLAALKFKKREGDVSHTRRVEGKPQIDIFRSMKTLFDDPRYKSYFKYKANALVGLVGIVRDWNVRTTKAGREMGTFKIFLGDSTSPGINVWPMKGETFISYKQKQFICNGQSGLAIVRPDIYNNRPQFTLIHFEPTNEKVKKK